MNKTIFTFWEPKTNMPAYLHLCKSTWQKFLPDYEIIVLDYSNIKEYMSTEFYKAFKNSKDVFTLPIQADAVRAEVLYNNGGGLWFDTDTIVTDFKIIDLLENNADFVLIDRHIAFIQAKSNKNILKFWRNDVLQILKNCSKVNFFYKHKMKKVAKILFPNTVKSMSEWNVLGNKILEKYLNNCCEKMFYSINKIQANALPEINYYQNSDYTVVEKYQKFYFKDKHKNFAKNNAGIILLHNSWTPEKYKKMTENEFLNCENSLSNLLKEILEN